MKKALTINKGMYQKEAVLKDENTVYLQNISTEDTLLRINHVKSRAKELTTCGKMESLRLERRSI